MALQMVTCAPWPTSQGTLLRSLCYPGTSYLLINMEVSGEKNQIIGDLRQHLPFPLKNFAKSNLKFSSVRFYLHLESEIIFSWKVPFFLYFSLPSDVILDTLPGVSSLQTLPAWHHVGLVCSWLRKCLHGFLKGSSV